MGIFSVRVSEVSMGPDGGISARVKCPPAAVPNPGQYVLSFCQGDQAQVLPAPLFLQKPAQEGFWAAPPIPHTWGPGTELEMRGPFGNGFQIPASARRIGLIAVGDTSSARLFPLMEMTLARDCAVALYSDQPLPALPSSVEAHPLDAAPEAIPWADFLAIDLPLAALSQLRQVLGLPHGYPIPCPAQVLILAAMPCGGIAACGACAVHARHGWKLACVDGPVFSLQEIEW
jgi:hypothetical protein